MSLYLDYNATTPCFPEVLKAWTSAAKQFGNPSSLYARGREAKLMLEDAREQVARFIASPIDRVLFTGSATEANNLALKGYFYACLKQGIPCHIVTALTEHSSVVETCIFLETQGAKITWLPVSSDGRILPETLDGLQGPGLVSLMMVNNETGVINPIKELTQKAKAASFLIHTDAVQAAGKLSISVLDLDVDFLTLSGHKCYAPKGVGALYVRQESYILPFVHGGGQEKRLRSGTENVPGIVAMGKAFEMLAAKQDEFAARAATLKNLFWTSVQKEFPNCQLNGAWEHTVSTTLNVSFQGKEGHALAIKLDLAGLAVSTGSACSTGSIEPSPVLLAMGLPLERVKGALRFSFGVTTTEEEIFEAVSLLKKILN